MFVRQIGNYYQDVVFLKKNIPNYNIAVKIIYYNIDNKKNIKTK